MSPPTHRYNQLHLLQLLPQGKLVQASTVLALALVVSVLVARALTVAPLVLLANLWRPRACRISIREGAVIWWAGAMRGASERGSVLLLGCRGGVSGRGMQWGGQLCQHPQLCPTALLSCGCA